MLSILTTLPLSIFLDKWSLILFFAAVDALELGCQLADGKQSLEDFALKVKGTTAQKTFNLLSEEKFMKHLDSKAAVSHFDMNKLEVEYDYDTEQEQINHSKSMLATDL